VFEDSCRVQLLHHHRIILVLSANLLSPLLLHVKGYLLVRQFVHKAGSIQLFLVPIVKNIHFLLVT
jgi:hypothetical protein